MAERTPEEWDAPHVLPKDCPDPFTRFLCNSALEDRMRRKGWSPERMAALRRYHDAELVQMRQDLAEALLSVPMEERQDWRRYVPQIEFWSSAEGMASRRVHPVWPWSPRDAFAPGEGVGDPDVST